MRKKKKILKNIGNFWVYQREKGIAALLTIFMLGFIAIFIGVTLVKTGYEASLRGRSQPDSLKAYYAAESGIEEAMIQVSMHDLGYPTQSNFELDVDDGKAQVKVWGTSEDQRFIESVGTYKNYIRRIKVEMQNTETKPGFGNAILAGLGGVTLRNQTLVTSKDGSGGNVYSNAFIKGAKNDYTVSTGECKNAASKVDGSAFAVEDITKLALHDSGVCVLNEAHANLLDYCWVNGDVFSPNPPSVNCPFSGSWTNEEAPGEIELPNLGVDIMKAYLGSKGQKFEGDCIADGSGDPSDCTFGTGELGNIVVTGNFNKPSNKSINISGPVWVKGDVVFDSLGTIGLTSDITKISQVFLTDGKIVSNSNVNYGSSGTAFLLFVSTYDPGVDEENVCDEGVDSAIEISSNSNSVLFYSMKGCVQVSANSLFHGAILGIGVRVDNNSTVEYDPALQTAIFGLTKKGGWQTLSFKEI